MDAAVRALLGALGAGSQTAPVIADHRRFRFDERASAGEGRNAHAEPGAIETRLDDARRERQMASRAKKAIDPGSGGFRRTFGGDGDDGDGATTMVE